MSSHQVAVFGILPNPIQARRAIDSLVLAGFRQGGISVLLTDGHGARDVTPGRDAKATEEAATGDGAPGATIGGTPDSLAGIGALSLPGFRPLATAGPGPSVTGASGGLVGGLIGLGISEYDARRYEGKVRDGGVLLSVHCDSCDELTSATEILARGGGTNVISANEDAVGSTIARNRGAY